jgi:hypothetical protein
MKKLLLATVVAVSFSISAFASDMHKNVVLLNATGNVIFDNNGFIIGRVADVTGLSVGADRILILRGTNLKNGNFEFISINQLDVHANQIYLKGK